MSNEHPDPGERPARLPFQFDAVPRDAMDLLALGKLEAIDCIVLALLVRWRQRGTDWAWSSNDRIAQAAGVSERTVTSSVARLKAAGLAERTKIGRDTNCPGNRTGYRFRVIAFDQCTQSQSLRVDPHNQSQSLRDDSCTQSQDLRCTQSQKTTPNREECLEKEELEPTNPVGRTASEHFPANESGKATMSERDTLILDEVIRQAFGEDTLEEVKGAMPRFLTEAKLDLPLVLHSIAEAKRSPRATPIACPPRWISSAIRRHVSGDPIAGKAKELVRRAMEKIDGPARADTTSGDAKLSAVDAVDEAKFRGAFAGQLRRDLCGVTDVRREVSLALRDLAAEGTRLGLTADQNAARQQWGQEVADRILSESYGTAAAS
jgi:predicted transcriptional regulator